MKKTIEYLCIDDQQDATIDPLLNKLSDSGSVAFVRHTPIGLEDQLAAIAQRAASSQGRFGLLLDLRLDVDADIDGNRVAYRGPTIAQELRTRMAEGDLPSFPIVLWSVNTKFKQSYFSDESSHDLFDGVFGKDEEVISRPVEVAKKLASLVRGYEALRGISSADALTRLGLDTNGESPIYAQFVAQYKLLSKQATHEVAHFLLNELVGVEGLLVTEDMVAARLGVDIQASGEQWQKVKDCLKPTKYAGPFSDGWDRWWWYSVEDWWESLPDNQNDLRRATAEERVSFLNQSLGVRLSHADPIEAAYSSKFSTLCVGLNKPLDPVDGLRVVSRAALPWQQTRYVSIFAALERIDRLHWRLDPLEKGRLARIKEERGGTS